jgi:hypothetical protein
VNAPQPPRTKFVGSLVADPARPPALLHLAGFLGDASEPGHTRLYFDAQLSDWIDVPDADFVHWVLPSDDEDTTVPAVVWLRQSATVRRRGPADGVMSLERFVTGALYRRRLDEAGVPAHDGDAWAGVGAGDETLGGRLVPTQIGFPPCPGRAPTVAASGPPDTAPTQTGYSPCPHHASAVVTDPPPDDAAPTQTGFSPCPHHASAVVTDPPPDDAAPTQTGFSPCPHHLMAPAPDDEIPSDPAAPTQTGFSPCPHHVAAVVTEPPGGDAAPTQTGFSPCPHKASS